MMIDVVMLCDFFVCVVCGEATRACIGEWVTNSAVSENSFGATFLKVAFDSFFVALVLRYPMTLKPKHTATVSGRLWVAELRCMFGFLSLAACSVLTEHGASEDLRWLLVWFVLFALNLAGTRFCFSIYVGWLYRQGTLREAVAIVGACGPRDRLAARISDEADIVGVYAAQPADTAERLDYEDLTQLLELERSGNLDSVVVAVEEGQLERMAGLIESLKVLPVQVAIFSDDDSSREDETALRVLCGVPVAVVADRPINRRGLLLKTLGDKCVALALLVALSPLMLGIAFAVGVSSEGPVIFQQTRQGWCGRRFTVYKFRTMRTPRDGLAWLHQTQRNDSRCTRIGRILRCTSLDELPQLWNVVRGDMSLVGPRPHDDSLHDLDRFGREIVAEYAQRYRVKPGITGWAQIHGARGPTHSVEQLRRRVAYDLYYIENWSPWLDLQILARTPLCLIGENVY